MAVAERRTQRRGVHETLTQLATTIARMSVNFGDAFLRWYQLTDGEHARLEGERKRNGTVLSWEALDHVCGLAVESGMKALLFHAKYVTPDGRGDYPPDPLTNQRPHVDKLWDTFIAKVQGRASNDWLKRLGPKGSTPTNVFLAWRSEHRYAADGTVSETTVTERVAFARRLKAIAQEEGF